MAGSKWMVVLAGAVALVACEASIGKHDEAKTDARGAGPEGKAEKGEFSIDMPAFKMKLDIPEALADRATVDSDSDIVYPGSKMSGIHVQGGNDHQSDGVELRFTSADAPAKVAAWYRDAARSDEFTIDSAREEQGGFVLEGKDKDDGDPFTVRLSPAGGGGTDARLTLTDRD